MTAANIQNLSRSDAKTITLTITAQELYVVWNAIAQFVENAEECDDEELLRQRAIAERLEERINRRFAKLAA